MKFNKIMENLVMNIMKTADDIKPFLAIFERTYYGLYMCVTICGCSMSLSKVMTRDVILHSPPKKEP